MAFLGGLGSKITAVASGGDGSGTGFQTLADYMGKGGANVGDELVVLFSHLEYACKKIAALVASPSSSNLGKSVRAAVGSADRDKPKPLDIVAVRILLILIACMWLCYVSRQSLLMFIIMRHQSFCVCFGGEDIFRRFICLSNVDC